MKWKSIQMPKELVVDETVTNDKYGRFIIEPLERGFGQTIGNAMRRVLLSSIQGAAFTSIKIDGILHEFSTISGVYEDMTDVILNIKKVNLKLIGDETKTVLLNVKGKGEYTAADFEHDAELEILNPDQHIVTLTDNVKFRMELEVGTGRGFVDADMNKKPDQPVGTIPLDAQFSPINKVNFEVENTRVGQRTDYDKLILHVWTTGAVTPEESLSFSAKLLKDHLNIFGQIDQEMEIAEEEKIDEEVLRIRNLLKMRVDELELSVRSSNCLHAANIVTIEDLIRKTEAEMLRYRNFGRKSLNELNGILSELGLSFGMDVEKYKEDTPDKD
ncbi:MAG: DNA-directed RNA polymerase subunit alpha [candidate division Zixibacteria bacterium 4484_95]|nr:MAG: DNA-directed RNA polymerase subunit alpha [candidate division Zixibacteria bacterium 4484_95]